VQVRYGEGLAIHTDPESCAGIREGTGEALTGARIGGVSSGVTTDGEKTSKPWKGARSFVDDGRRLVHHYRQQKVKVDVRQEQFCEMFSSSVRGYLRLAGQLF
jgi:hypothetical protein